MSDPKSSPRESRPVRDSRIEVTDGALIPPRNEKQVFSAWRISFFGAILLLIYLYVVQK